MKVLETSRPVRHPRSTNERRDSRDRDRERVVRVLFTAGGEDHPRFAAMSLVRQNFHEECEDALNKQINLELYASYVYLSMVSRRID